MKDDAAAVITANIDFSRKLNLIQTMVDLQATDKSPVWRSDATALLDAIRGLNDPPRVIVAHSQFEPVADDSVRFKRTIAKKTLKREEPVWTKSMFEKHFSDMGKYTAELDRLILDLEPVSGATNTF